MDSANPIQSLADNLEKNPDFKLSEQEASSILSEVKRIVGEEKTNMPPLIVIIMAYINIIFPEIEEVKP